MHINMPPIHNMTIYAYIGVTASYIVYIFRCIHYGLTFECSNL